MAFIVPVLLQGQQLHLHQHEHRLAKGDSAAQVAQQAAQLDEDYDE